MDIDIDIVTTISAIGGGSVTCSIAYITSCTRGGGGGKGEGVQPFKFLVLVLGSWHYFVFIVNAIIDNINYFYFARAFVHGLGMMAALSVYQGVDRLGIDLLLHDVWCHFSFGVLQADFTLSDLQLGSLFAGDLTKVLKPPILPRKI